MHGPHHTLIGVPWIVSLSSLTRSRVSPAGVYAVLLAHPCNAGSSKYRSHRWLYDCNLQSQCARAEGRPIRLGAVFEHLLRHAAGRCLEARGYRCRRCSCLQACLCICSLAPRPACEQRSPQSVTAQQRPQPMTAQHMHTMHVHTMHWKVSPKQRVDVHPRTQSHAPAAQDTCS